MAVTVKFYDPTGCMISEVVGKGDSVVARLFSEFLVDELKARGYVVRAEIKSDDSKTENRLPNFREAAEDFARILAARKDPIQES